MSPFWRSRLILTGEPAEEVIEHLPGVSKATIEEHEDAATFAFAGVLAVGVAALGGLVFHWRAKPAPNWIVVVVLVLSVIVFAMMIRTANLGETDTPSGAAFRLSPSKQNKQTKIIPKGPKHL